MESPTWRALAEAAQPGEGETHAITEDVGSNSVTAGSNPAVGNLGSDLIPPLTRWIFSRLLEVLETQLLRL